MSKYLIFLISVGFTAVSFSCKNAKSPFQPKTALISGLLSDADKPDFLLKGASEISGKLNSDGSFSEEIKVEDAGIFLFSMGRFQLPVFLKPGNQLSIKGSLKRQTPFEFEGDNTLENKYLQDYYSYKMSLADNNYGQFYTQDEASFIKGVEERTQALVEHSQEFQKVNGVFDADFLDLLTQDMAFESAVIKMNYPEYYKFFRPDSVLILSETYDSFLQNIDADNPDQFAIPSYHEFLPIYLDFTVQLDTLASDYSRNLKKYQAIDKLFSQNEVKSKLYLNLAEEMIATSVDDFNAIVNDFTKKNIQPESQVKLLLQGFDSIKHLVRGGPAPDGIFKNMQGADVSFKNFKGKVLYIDVWATWCGPCIREIPALEKKQEEYKNKDVVFISISVDEEPGPWEYMVKDKNLKGQQWYAPQAWSSSLAQDYRINGIPRFMIIDREGNIFNAYAPRPSFPEFDKVILEALDL